MNKLANPEWLNPPTEAPTEAPTAAQKTKVKEPGTRVPEQKAAATSTPGGAQVPEVPEQKAAALPDLPDPAAQDWGATLARLEAAAAPLRALLSEIDVELGALAAFVPAGASIPEAIAEKRQAAARAADLSLEREVIVGRLAPLDGALVEARAEAAAQAKAEARAAAIARGAEALAKVEAAVEALGTAVEALAELSETDRKAGLAWGFIPELHFAANRLLNGPLARIKNKIRASGNRGGQF